MNELQVKTINLSPAIVEFNFDELSQILDSQLAKYDGLEFTEKDAAECKKTITELNKGKKALDVYRKETKKELTASVTEFENKCKELALKFDSVINPLKEQHDQFEENRKSEKRKEIQKIIDGLIEKEGLNDKYAAQLVIEESYLTKSKSMASIKAELMTNAKHLGIKQDKEESDQEVIRSHVELINTNYNVTLLEEAYTVLLEFQSVGEIKNIIESHAQIQVEKEEQYEEVPVSSAPASVSKDNEYTFVEVYKVKGTESQLDALEEYMSGHGLTWKVIKK